ncbi:MAG: hypothetical protein JXQ96_01235 [Cyclobacteriaceae bacterium]
MRSILSFVIFLASISTLMAQGDIPVGEWRTHFNYQNARLIEYAEGKIYCATENGFFYYDTEDNSLNILDKVSGLSDVGVSAMHYDESLKTLAIGYTSGNIDLINENEVTNIEVIKNSSRTESKRINFISATNGRIYAATNFGIIVFDASSAEVIEAFQNLGPQGEVVSVQALDINEAYIYAATDLGAMRGALAQNINLQDFNNWERFSDEPFSAENIISIQSLGNKVFITTGSDLYSFDGSIWANLTWSGLLIRKLRSSESGTELIIVTESGISTMDGSGNVSKLIIEAGAQPGDAIVTDGSELWFADMLDGLTRVSSGQGEKLIPNGIFKGAIGKLKYTGETMTAVPYFLESRINYTVAHNDLGYATFENGAWTTMKQDELEGLRTVSSVSGGFAASFSDGLLDLTQPLIYDEANSPLERTGSDVKVAAIEADNEGDLWVANGSEGSPLLRLSSDGNWQEFSFAVEASKRPIDMKVNSQGEVWMILGGSQGGLLAFDPDVDDYRYFASSVDFPSSRVTDVAFAGDDEIWIATDKGLAFFPFSFGVIEDKSLKANRPIFDNRILLDGEYISAIEIDGGDRRWIGTQDGLWLFEDNADRVIHNFDVDNSPLPSNNILDLEIDPVSGEIFIATDKGLVSFRSDATDALSFHQNVKIFPNPVLPGYSGHVGISGLAQDANVKITSVSGRLVKELFAAGGSTSWDVADYNGVRAQAGVYLVFSSSSDGKETFVGKIAVVN